MALREDAAIDLSFAIIGIEAKEQLALAGDYPDVVIGCHGGGSNFAGIAFPFAALLISGS